MIRNIKAKAMVLAFLRGAPVPPNDSAAQFVVITSLLFSPSIFRSKK